MNGEIIKSTLRSLAPVVIEETSKKLPSKIASTVGNIGAEAIAGKAGTEIAKGIGQSTVNSLTKPKITINSNKNIPSASQPSFRDTMIDNGVHPELLDIISNYANISSESGFDYPTAKQVAYDVLGNKNELGVGSLDRLSRNKLKKANFNNTVFRAVPKNPEGADGMSWFTDRDLAEKLVANNPEDYAMVESYNIMPEDTVISPDIVKELEPTGGLSNHIIIRRANAPTSAEKELARRFNQSSAVNFVGQTGDKFKFKKDGTITKGRGYFDHPGVKGRRGGSAPKTIDTE